MNNSQFNCPNCGSNDLLLMTSYTCKCHHCGSVFNVERDNSKKNNIVTKIVTDERQIFLALPKNGEIMYFIKSSFVKLYTDEFTSVNTVNANFAPAYEEVSTFGVIEADYALSYSADIGYDRTETYYETETYYVNGKPNYRQVARTRVVTDWHPISSTYFGGDISTFCKIDDNDGIYDVSTEETHFKDIYSYNSCVPLNSLTYAVTPFSATEDMLSSAISAGEDIAASQCQNSLPGDHVANFRYTATHTVKKIYNVSKLDYVCFAIFRRGTKLLYKGLLVRQRPASRLFAKRGRFKKYQKTNGKSFRTASLCSAYPVFDRRSLIERIF